MPDGGIGEGHIAGVVAGRRSGDLGEVDAIGRALDHEPALIDGVVPPGQPDLRTSLQRGDQVGGSCRRRPQRQYI